MPKWKVIVCWLDFWGHSTSAVLDIWCCLVTFAGVIAGIVSYIILYIVTIVLDFLSDKTNGLFGYNKEAGHVDGPIARQQTFHLRKNDTAEGSTGSSEDSQAAKVISMLFKCQNREILFSLCLSILLSAPFKSSSTQQIWFDYES